MYVAWWFHTEKHRNDLFTIDTAAGLMKYGIMEEGDLIDVSWKDFREALKAEGVPPIACDMLSNKYVARTLVSGVDELVSGVNQISIAGTPERSSSSMPDLFQPIHNNKPKDMLLSRLKILEESRSLAPFLAIVQSSGYGKTRTILEVAKARRVVYLLCSDIKGGLQSPAVVDNFVKEITAAEKTEFRERRAETFLRCVVHCAEPYEMAEGLFKAQFTRASFGSFYDDLATTVEQATTPPTSPIKNETDEIETVEAPPKSSSPPLVVVFDEALCLTGNEEHNRDSPYRRIRRILKYLGGLIGVFLDTLGKLHIFAPECASSDRVAGIGIFPPPIFEIDTFDEFRSDNVNPFFFGRPLWWMQWSSAWTEIWDAWLNLLVTNYSPRTSVKILTDCAPCLFADLGCRLVGHWRTNWLPTTWPHL